jgi:hypothetical protein
MGSLIDELRCREAAAGQEAEELRERIAQLTERLARAEERLSRLVITRETVDEVLNGSGAEAPAAVLADGVAPSRSGHRPAVGVLAVPQWRAGLEASALPVAYRDLLEVAEDAGRPLRAGQIAAAAGLGTDKAAVEGLRSKLKRLAGRGWLAEEAGLFTLPSRNGTREAAKPG